MKFKITWAKSPPYELRSTDSCAYRPWMFFGTCQSLKPEYAGLTALLFICPWFSIWLGWQRNDKTA